MKRKVIYSLFLTIGIILFSCESDDDKMVTNTYNYINNSGKQLQMMVYSSKDELLSNDGIPIGDTLSFIIIAEGGAGPFQFETSHGDSIYLNFSNDRYQIYRKDYDSIFLVKSYVINKISDQKQELFYYFTTDDYENAIIME